MSERITILGIPGSLRAASFNRALLNAAAEIAPENMAIQVFDGLGAIPLYNEDLEQRGEPEAVHALKQAIRDADALLIATPEYNFGVPGVLKNAIDWASRPARGSPLQGKPAAILGASPGAFGTVRAQMALRQSFLFTETHVLLKPELHVSRAAEKFDSQGRLVDEATRTRLRELLSALFNWTRRINSPV